MAAGDAIDTGAAFRPHVLREYALLADGERGALIGPHGEITWMCAPRWDSDAVFSALIGGGGVYAVTPADERHVWGGYYEPGSLIWHSRWITSDGVIECREALAFPGDPGRVVLLRRIIAAQGPARVRVLLDPRPGFGRHGSYDLTQHDGVWAGRAGPLRWRWAGGGDAKSHQAAHGRGEVLAMELTIPEGDHHDLVLELAEKDLSGDMINPGREWTATEAA